ncbi:MAG: fatty acid desaturase family protein, partial [Sediminibacterium sp.]
MTNISIPKFPVVKQSLHLELKKRVQAYFDERGIQATGTPKLFTKAITMVVAFILVYVHLIFFTPIWYIAVFECVILGG